MYGFRQLFRLLNTKNTMQITLINWKIVDPHTLLRFIISRKQLPLQSLSRKFILQTKVRLLNMVSVMHSLIFLTWLKLMRRNVRSMVNWMMWRDTIWCMRRILSISRYSLTVNSTKMRQRHSWKDTETYSRRHLIVWSKKDILTRHVKSSLSLSIKNLASWVVTSIRT